MSDLPIAFKPLAGQLYRRIEARHSILKDALAEVQASCSRDGLAISGALVRRTMRVFAEEAKIRTDLIETETRKYRVSCSPNQLIEGQKELSDFLQHMTMQALTYVSSECEQVTNVLLRVDASRHKSMTDLIRKDFADTTRNCCGLIKAVVEELAMAAETEKQATTSADRPSYIYQNTFQAPVGAVAQGQASVGSVHQTNHNNPSLNELVSLMNAAVADWSPDDRKLSAGAEAMLIAEAKLDQPDVGLLRSAVNKLGKIAETAATSVATQTFLAYLKAHGWGP